MQCLLEGGKLVLDTERHLILGTDFLDGQTAFVKQTKIYLRKGMPQNSALAKPPGGIIGRLRQEKAVPIETAKGIAGLAHADFRHEFQTMDPEKRPVFVAFFEKPRRYLLYFYIREKSIFPHRNGEQKI